jgi:transcriptional regulator with XRE-family HTH domain
VLSILLRVNIMGALTETLGKRLTAQEVAEYLGVDAETVRRYYHSLGGIRLGRLILFFENLMIDKIKEKSNAIQKKEKEQEDGVDSRCDAQREEILQDIRYQDRGARLGIRNKKSSRKRLDDPFGILDAD